jgi:hypothetical protein
MQNMRQQQTGRAAADNRDLSARSRCHSPRKGPIAHIGKRDFAATPANVRQICMKPSMKAAWKACMHACIGGAMPRYQ